MKINDSVSSSSAASPKSVVGKGPSGAGEVARGSGGATAGKSSGASGGATVRIDPLSSQIAAAEQVLNDVPVVDAQKVAEVREAIAQGRLQVNAEKVADRLIGSVKDLILTQRG